MSGFDAESFLEGMNMTGRVPGTRVNERLEPLEPEHRKIVLEFLRNESVSAKRVASMASRAGLKMGEGAVRGWRENRDVLDVWGDSDG